MSEHDTPQEPAMATPPAGEMEAPAERDAVTAESLGLELPEAPEEAIATLLGELYDARQLADANLDQLQRKAAEFENYRKRSLRELAAIREMGSERLASALLPTLDSFEAALALPAETEAEQRLLAGMNGTYAQLMDALSREGLEVLPGVGASFDPTIHEAVSAPSEAGGALVVGHELRRGYRLKDKVLRASLVALESGEQTAEESEATDQVGSES